MKPIHSSTRVARCFYKLLLSLAALGLIFAGRDAPAGALLQEYIPLHVGDHTTWRGPGGTNTIIIEAGVAEFPGSFAAVTFVPSGTNSSYIGDFGNNRVTYEDDSGNGARVIWTPPGVTMTESALASLGTPFTGTSWYTNSFLVGGQSYETVGSQTISGVVNSAGTVTVVAGTFP